MKIKISQFYTVLLLCIIAVSSSLIFSGCQKEMSAENGIDLNGNNTNNTTNTLSDNITALGRVADINNNPVIGAVVSSGTQTATTDAKGVFKISNLSTSGGFSSVTVSKANYFTGSRTFQSKQGTDNYIQITMLSKSANAPTFNSGSGGVITDSGSQAQIVFVPNSVMLQNGSAYTGEVKVYTRAIDPTQTGWQNQMPGALVGTRTNGNTAGLQSFGMLAVELETETGQPLQLAAGKTATIKMPIPVGLQANAPATIPLWWFDNSTGKWKEEGTATKVGNQYVGTVSHFTFWNWDIPYDMVNLQVTIVNTQGTPFAHAMVKITQVSTGATVWDYTDNTGWVGGPIPKNQALKIEVLSSDCNTVLYQNNIGPFSTDVNLGTITVATPHTMSITGTVRDCNNQPMSLGYAYIKFNNSYTPIVVTISGGTVNAVYAYCNAMPTNATISIVNSLQGQFTLDTTINVVNGNLNLSSVNGCGIDVNAGTYFNVYYDGVLQTFPEMNPQYNVGFVITEYYCDALNTNCKNAYFIGLVDDFDLTPPNPNVTTSTIGLWFGGNIQPALSQNMNVEHCGFTYEVDSARHPLAVPPYEMKTFNNNSTNNLHISQYDSVGGYIAGTYQELLQKLDNSGVMALDTILLKVDFKVKRIQDQ